MSDFRTKNQAVAVKLEAEPGLDALPTLAVNAILVEAPQAAAELETTDTEEVTGTLDDRGPLPGGGRRPFTGVVYLKGAGVPGVAPEAAPLLRACGLAETILPADLVQVATAAGASSVTLPSVAGLAVGMVVLVTAGAGVGYRGVIAGIAGQDVSLYPVPAAALDATSEITVPACVLYTPASADLPTATIYRWRHSTRSGVPSKLDRITGAAGSFSLAVNIRQPARLNVNFMGQLHDPEDVPHPGAPVYDAARAPVFMGADVWLAGLRTRMSALTVNSGGNVQMDDDPNARYGYAEAGITSRRAEGRINPPLALQSARDVLESWRRSVTAPLWAAWGEEAGNRLSVFLPEIQYTGSEEEDVSGFAREGLPFRSARPDAGGILCVW